MNGLGSIFLHGGRRMDGAAPAMRRACYPGLNFRMSANQREARLVRLVGIQPLSR